MLSVTEGREFYRKGKKGGSALVCARGFRPTAADEGSFLLEDYVRGGVGPTFVCTILPVVTLPVRLTARPLALPAHGRSIR